MVLVLAIVETLTFPGATSRASQVLRLRLQVSIFRPDRGLKRRYYFFFGGLIMMWAPGVPGCISHGTPSAGLVLSPVEAAVA